MYPKKGRQCRQRQFKIAGFLTRIHLQQFCELSRRDVSLVWCVRLKLHRALGKWQKCCKDNACEWAVNKQSWGKNWMRSLKNQILWLCNWKALAKHMKWVGEHGVYATLRTLRVQCRDFNLLRFPSGSFLSFWGYILHLNIHTFKLSELTGWLGIYIL